MKILALFMVSYITALGASLASAEDASLNIAPSALKVIIAIPAIYSPEQNRSIPLALVDQQADAHFSVVIENVSSHPVFLWSEETPGGWGTLSFEITETDGKTIQIRRQEILLEPAIVSLDRLDPGEVQVREVYYATDKTYYNVTKHSRPLDQQWTPGFPFAGNHEKTVTIRAVFVQQPSTGASKWNLWTGKVVSAPYKVVLHGD